MTPKEKAKQLVDRFIEMNQQHSSDTEEEYGNSYEYHKKCALIVVNEVIDLKILSAGWAESCKHLSLNKSQKPYWEEVKQEINKL
jgi:hypothetical protein